jgi:hypothetical protein
MNERGEKGMGFSQTATTHHFLLNPNGGVIQVEAKDAADATNRTEIRLHLEYIAKAFHSGDFDIPLFVHDTVPLGVPEMKRSNPLRCVGCENVVDLSNKASLLGILGRREHKRKPEIRRGDVAGSMRKWKP